MAGAGVRFRPKQTEAGEKEKECAFPLKLRHAGAGGITNGAELLSVPLQSGVHSQ